MTTTTPTPGPTFDQRRARHAWTSITGLAQRDGDKRLYGAPAKEYAQEARKLTSRIRAAGLGPALAFILAKAKDKKPNLTDLHEHLTDWVIRQRGIPARKADSLLQSVIEGDSTFLRRATEEALAYLVWLNRFAEAEGLTEAKEDSHD